jgi:hypothetical protein
LRLSALTLAVAVFAPPASAHRQSASQPGTAMRERSAVIEREVEASPGGGLRVVAGPAGGVQVSVWRERKMRIEARVELRAPTEAELDALTKVVGVFVEPSPTGVVVTTKGPHDKKWM